MFTINRRQLRVQCSHYYTKTHKQHKAKSQFTNTFDSKSISSNCFHTRDQMEDHIQKEFHRKPYFLKTTLQLVFSVSVFCIFIWYSSGFSIHPQSFNAYFSTCLFSMFTHTLERKYMFLICNGILAFVAKTSLMMTSSESISDSVFNLSETKSPVSDMVVVVPTMQISESHENVVPLIMVEQQVNCQEEESYEEVSDQEESDLLSTKPEGTENEEGGSIADDADGKSELGGTEEAQDDEVEETTMMTATEELVNTEELNRKFEEFIRKMKEEMRIDAQRQLIAV